MHKNGNFSNSQGRLGKVIDLHCVVVQCWQIMFVERDPENGRLKRKTCTFINCDTQFIVVQSLVTDSCYTGMVYALI